MGHEKRERRDAEHRQLPRPFHGCRKQQDRYRRNEGREQREECSARADRWVSLGLQGHAFADASIARGGG